MPSADDKDEYLFYGKEQYPPEKSSSVLVPGKRVTAPTIGMMRRPTNPLAGWEAHH
jgi:hypothetical protein